MMYKNKFTFAMTMLAVTGLALNAGARPNVNSGQKTSSKAGLKTTASTCKAAEATIDLDINNIRARLMTGGDMWWDQGTGEARYEVPKGSKKNSLFAGSVWIGGKDEGGGLKVAAQTYRQDGNDYWPGPLDASANITQADCSEWDRFWKINRETVNRFKDMKDKSAAKSDPDFEVLLQWPAKGNTEAIGRNQNNLNIGSDKDLAPFIDVDANGIYNPIEGGDYPGYQEVGNIKGDQMIWWVFNDNGNVKQQTQTEGIGIEVQASAFAYASKDFLNDATFYSYRLVNRSNRTLDSTYIATWTDADLGWYLDDYIGCDTTRGLGILYNGNSTDGSGQPQAYGENVPMVGIDFFQGPEKTYDSAGVKKKKRLGMEAFTYYNNTGGILGNPSNGAQIYNYMTGSILNGERFTNDFTSAGTVSKGYGSGPVTKFVFTGDPGNSSQWSECVCGNPTGDRRFVHSSGPFKLEAGVVNDIVIAAIWVSDVGGCPNTSFKKIVSIDDQAQNLYDGGFKTVEGPEAPRMVVRELDKKLVFYLVNDPSSNNYLEQYGTNLSEQKYRAPVQKAVGKGLADSLYKFEGYRVFQLYNATVTPAQIFNDKGEVNAELAREVFQTDIRNGLSTLINYDKNIDVSDTTWEPRIKVVGKDSGIVHSFEVTTDQFATGSNKRLVNYHNYYFVAIAYGFNDFSGKFDNVSQTFKFGFDPRAADSTQERPYIESAHGANGSPLAVVTGMPNASNGNMGTVLNSDFGGGVIIKRLEGTGNGGNAIEMDSVSEMGALATGQIINPTYKRGRGPVNIKVIDPVGITPGDWELYIKGSNKPNAQQGLANDSKWELKNVETGKIIFSERNIAVANEQILEDYGISINIQQVLRPGDNQGWDNGRMGNGLITSKIIFADPNYPWLAGVSDGEQRSAFNWIRSGKNHDDSSNSPNHCNYDDWRQDAMDTITQSYEKLLPDFAFTKGTWAPYALGASDFKAFTNIYPYGKCFYGTVLQTTNLTGIVNIGSVDIVFTPDRSKWTRSAVVEMQEDVSLAEGNATKFDLRKHASWTGDVNTDGSPIYDAAEQGMSWFPGYAVNQETGERLNIVFGEDSYQKNQNGSDMLWNPTSTDVIPENDARIYGGKHVVYVCSTKYDKCASFVATNKALSFRTIWYTGMPLLNKAYKYNSWADGFIPNETRIQIRVNRPYGNYNTGSQVNGGNPLYSFSTRDVAPTPLADNENADKKALLAKIQAVPNPYYGANGFENSRLDTRVRIINLPHKATVSIYSLDGALITRLEKDNPNVAHIDWNVRNSKGLPIASGMYLMHVEAEGIGETVIKWFGAMRPLDITSY
jgi:hypothetical protein